ncbi:hypothetical protein [Alteromonas sp. 14N.309.X.WAT.G.H12]|uniref:hypothetical protein n=1 Tax=Alteromonas sp. 14N.309.X.WAT.G.H12 TaxID=3120824 RepID=UPI002FCE6D44
MKLKVYFMQELHRTWRIILTHKYMLMFYVVIASVTQLQAYSLEYKAAMSAAPTDIAQAVASGSLLLWAETLAAICIFSMITAKMKRTAVGKVSVFGLFGIVAYSSMFLVVYLITALVMLGLLYTSLGGTSLLDGTPTDPEDAKHIAGTMMLFIPLVMGFPYAASALALRQFAKNNAIKAISKRMKRQERKKYGYLPSYIVFFNVWKQLVTKPYYVVLSILFVLLVSPEIYLPDALKSSMLSTFIVITGHVLLLLIYLSAYNGGLISYLLLPTVDDEEENQGNSVDGI